MDSVSNRVRPRVGGLLIEHDEILLVKIDVPTRNHPIWMPPGGEIEFGEPMTTALQREYTEETGLEIETQELAYIHEFIHPPFHAVELYFFCRRIGGSIAVGRDPEFNEDEQIVLDVKYIPLSKLSETAAEPEFLQQQLVEDWRKDSFIHPRWIGTTN